MKSNQVIWVAVGLCIFFWFLESALHVFIFPEGSFTRNLFIPAPHELWMRLIVISSIIGLSLYSQFMITRRRRAEERLVLYQEQLRSLVSELVLTEERERRRLATDLHDSISQVLAIAKLKLDGLQEKASSRGLEKGLDEVRQFISQALQQTRSLTFEISPPVLYHLGLEAALESLAEQVQERHAIRTDFEDDKKPKPLTGQTQVLLFRAVQELLINIVKHAQARSARVSVAREGDHVRIRVTDNGIGFDPSEINISRNGPGRFGLLSIKERLHHLKGYCEIKSKPSQGTQVTLITPLEHEEQTAEGKAT
ncbi:MAG: hypothetical protein GTO12_28750 [Proteobacteria bacterium]|nr:hypothetical protein [Pseudomonadota bacterium]